MKLHKKNSKKHLVIALATIVAIASAGLVWYFAFSDRGPDKDRGTETQQHMDTSKGQSAGQADKETETKTEADGESVPHESEKELPQLYEGENTNNSEGLTGAINSKSVSGEYLIIRNTINQFVDSGTCELTLRSDNKTVRRSAEIIQNPSSSSCAGFDIPVSELSSGRWDIEIKVSGGGKQVTLSEVVNI